MKKLLLLAFILINTFAKAQADLDILPLQNGRVVFNRSSDALDEPKNNVFSRAKYWMGNNIAMGMAIQSADTTTGLITGNGHFLLKLKGGNFSENNNRFDFKIQVSCSDGQYTLNIDSLTFIQLDANGKPTSSAIPLETEAKTNKANANIINMQFENIYFSLIDAMSNAPINSNTLNSYVPPPSNQLYLNLIKTTSGNNEIDYDTPDKELIRLHKTVSNTYNALSVYFFILRPIAEAVDRPVLLTFDDGATDTLQSKSYWTKQGNQFLYGFTWNPTLDGMRFLKQKKIQKIQMAETIIDVDDLLGLKVKAWANYLDNLTVANTGVSTSGPNQAPDQLNALPEVDGKVFYQSMIDVPNKSQDFIFAAANKWMLDNFNKGKSNGILSEDKDQGQILGQGTFKIDEPSGPFSVTNDYTYGFKIQIDCKDNKYRIQFNLLL